MKRFLYHLPFLSNFPFLFRPSWWIMNYTYSAEWDKQLTLLLDQHTFTNISEYEATLGGVKLWVSNHPYGSMRPDILRVRASRATILRAHNQLIRDAVAQALKP